MKPRLNKILLIMIILFPALNVFAEVKLKTEAEVAAYADSITGFKDINGITKTFKQVVITDDNTPFLHTQINGKKVWVAEIKHVRLKFKDENPKYTDKYLRTFKIFIDPNEGTLLKITSEVEGFDPNKLPEPNAVSEQLLGTNGKPYLGFPVVPPKINLYEALDNLRSRTLDGVSEALIIDALYVWYFEKDGATPRRAWVIMLGGRNIKILRSTAVRAEPLRNEARRTYWWVIDADSNRFISSGYTPLPKPLNIRISPPGLKGETDEQKRLIANMNELYSGMSKEQVKKILGPPSAETANVLFYVLKGSRTYEGTFISAWLLFDKEGLQEALVNHGEEIFKPLNPDR